jgi:hypothetical protein
VEVLKNTGEQQTCGDVKQWNGASGYKKYRRQYLTKNKTQSSNSKGEWQDCERAYTAVHAGRWKA